jgi:putative pre-16S rRNA nuclease
MRLLGIDYGEKRMGLALSDAGGRMAFPKEILENAPGALARIADIARREHAEEIVLGESLDASGRPNRINKEIEEFADKLRDGLNLPVHFEKEFFTSVEARRYQESGERADARAAALILQRYLDRRNKN